MISKNKHQKKVFKNKVIKQFNFNKSLNKLKVINCNKKSIKNLKSNSHQKILNKTRNKKRMKTEILN